LSRGKIAQIIKFKKLPFCAKGRKFFSVLHKTRLSFLCIFTVGFSCASCTKDQGQFCAVSQEYWQYAQKEFFKKAVFLAFCRLFLPVGLL
jgi:hypothetical protein